MQILQYWLSKISNMLAKRVVEDLYSEFIRRIFESENLSYEV